MSADLLQSIVSHVEQYLDSGHAAQGCEVVHDRSQGRGMLLRIHDIDGQRVIVKAWALRNLRERLKQRVGISNGFREWSMHRHIEQIGLAVPTPMGYVCAGRSRTPFETMAVADLGPTLRGLVYLKQCISESNEAEVERFENCVLDMTAQLVASRVDDVDHQLNNIVLDEANQVYRIDFECARRWRIRNIPDLHLGAMISRLVCSHAYACQPVLERTERFAHRLAERIMPSARALAHARQRIDATLQRQHQRKGIDSRLTLAW